MFNNFLNASPKLKKITWTISYEVIPLGGEATRCATDLILDDSRLGGSWGIGGCRYFSRGELQSGEEQLYLFMEAKEVQRLSIKNCTMVYDGYGEDEAEVLSQEMIMEMVRKHSYFVALAQERFNGRKYCKNETRETRYYICP